MTRFADMVFSDDDEDDDDARDIVISVEGHGWDTRWDKLRESLRQWSVH